MVFLSVRKYIMAEGVNVRFAGELQKFIQSRVDSSGLYSSASEYLRDLVRRDYEREEERKWSWLESELQPGLKAKESEFITLDAGKILKEARARRKAHGR
jgi:antitoxin ParD1/3/4